MRISLFLFLFRDLLKLTRTVAASGTKSSLVRVPVSGVWRKVGEGMISPLDLGVGVGSGAFGMCFAQLHR
jgi:hypothetical protein